MYQLKQSSRKLWVLQLWCKEQGQSRAAPGRSSALHPRDVSIAWLPQAALVCMQRGPGIAAVPQNACEGTKEGVSALPLTQETQQQNVSEYQLFVPKGRCMPMNLKNMA